MKLRIKGNTIRFRLTQTEVDNLAEGSVEDKIMFPAGKSLVYRIQSGEKTEVNFTGGAVSISVPSENIKSWASTDQVEINTLVMLEDNNQLEISIEKDFKCLTERPKEDESDMYPNPLEKHSKC